LVSTIQSPAGADATSVASCGSSFAGSGALHRGGEVGVARRRRRRDGAPRLALLDEAERMRDDAVGKRGDDVVFGERPRPCVLLLEQHPAVLAIAGFGDAYELPQAGELLAVEPKDELAARHRGARITFGLPRAAVPDDDGAGAVLARRDRSFERRVIERMVLDVDRHLHLRRVERRALSAPPS
jgi:hypothetical protein